MFFRVCCESVLTADQRGRPAGRPYISFATFALHTLKCSRKFSGGPWLSKTGICSRQDAKRAKSGSLISWRPLRLCARYSEFSLRLYRRRQLVKTRHVVMQHLLLGAVGEIRSLPDGLDGVRPVAVPVRIIG